MMAYNNLEAPCTVAISMNAVTEAGLGSAEDDERTWEFLGPGIQRIREPL